jgi:hypothetical protein
MSSKKSVFLDLIISSPERVDFVKAKNKYSKNVVKKEEEAPRHPVERHSG